MWTTAATDNTVSRLTTSASQRFVSVSWTASEDARLQQIATYLGTNPAQVQKTAVYLLGFLIGFLSPNPLPQALPAAGVATIYTSAWDPSEQSVIDNVDTKFVLNDADSTRFSVNLLSFLLGLQGH